MSRDRGIRLQNALAAYLQRWWPSAESAGSGRPGTDVLGTPGVVWECKTATDFKAKFNPTMWVRQSERHMGAPAEFMPHIVPVTVYFPAGIGEKGTQHTLAITPLHVMVRLLNQAGYGASDDELSAANARAAEEAFSKLALEGQRKFKEES